MRRIASALAIALVAGVFTTAPAAEAGTALHLGFYDQDVSFNADPALRATWLGKIVGVGADRIRLVAAWSRITTHAPAPGEDPADPAWAGYGWTALDTAVTEAVAHGLAPVIDIVGAPSWAEGAHRPASAPAGTWRPDPQKLAEFAHAAATRYSGRDGALPAVRAWQVWNEPNLSVYLTPQWVGGDAASPDQYRRMLEAAYTAIKAVDGDNIVVTAGTAPFGDPLPGGKRIAPALFVRKLLSQPVHFDVLAHHPYSVRGPEGAALNVDDVSVPDLAKLTKPLRAAERSGRALPGERHGLWITELSWDSSPPDPDGVPAARQARWLEEALYVLWRAGADTVLWYQARDEAPVPSYADTYQSGVFLRDGTAKPSATAFAFPFVALRRPNGRVALWGKAPASGPLSVQRRLADGSWRAVAHLVAPDDGRPFTGSTAAPRGARMRAVSGGATSLSWTVR